MGRKAWNMNDRRLSGSSKLGMFIAAVIFILIGVALFNSSSEIIMKIIGGFLVLSGLCAIFGGMK